MRHGGARSNPQVTRLRETRDQSSPWELSRPDTAPGRVSRWTVHVYKHAQAKVVWSLRSREMTTPLDFPNSPMTAIRAAGLDLLSALRERSATGAVRGVASQGTARMFFELRPEGDGLSLVEMGEPVQVRLGQDAVTRLLLAVEVPGQKPLVLQEDTRGSAGRSMLAELTAQMLTALSDLPDMPTELRHRVLPAHRPAAQAAVLPVAPLADDEAAAEVDSYLRGRFGGGTEVSAKLTKVFEETLREWPRAPGDLAKLVDVAARHAWSPTPEQLPARSARGLLALELAADERIVGPAGESGAATARTVAAAAQLAVDVPSSTAFAMVLPKVLNLLAEWLTGTQRRLVSYTAVLTGEIAAGDEDRAAALLQAAPWLALHCQRSPYFPRLATSGQEAFTALRTGRALQFLTQRHTGLKTPLLRTSPNPLSRARHWYVVADEAFWPGSEDEFTSVLRALDQQGQHAVLLLDQYAEGSTLGVLALAEAQQRLGERVETDQVAVVFDAAPSSTQVALVNLDGAGYAECEVGDERYVLAPYAPTVAYHKDFWLQLPSGAVQTVRVAGRPVGDRPPVTPRGVGPDLLGPELDEQTFAGRKTELAEIANALGGRDRSSPSVLVSGPRRAGKTTLAYRSVSRLREQGEADHLVMLDLGRDIPLSDPAAVNRLASRMLVRKLRREGFVAEGAEELTDLADTLIEIDEQAQDDGVRLAIVLDEFDVLFASPEAPPALREMARRITARSWRGIALVLTVQRFSARAVEVKQAHQVECLPHLGWEACLRYFGAMDDLVVGPQVAPRLVLPHALLVESVEPRLGLRPFWWASLRLLLESATRVEDRRFATADDVDAAYEQLLEDNWFLHLLLRPSGMEPSLNDRLFDTYSVGEKRILLELAEGGRTHLTSAQASAISDGGLRELLDRRIVSTVQNGKSIALAEPVYRDFVNRHRPALTAQVTTAVADGRLA